MDGIQQNARKNHRAATLVGNPLELASTAVLALTAVDPELKGIDETVASTAVLAIVSVLSDLTFTDEGEIVLVSSATVAIVATADLSMESALESEAVLALVATVPQPGRIIDLPAFPAPAVLAVSQVLSDLSMANALESSAVIAITGDVLANPLDIASEAVIAITGTVLPNYPALASSALLAIVKAKMNLSIGGLTLSSSAVISITATASLSMDVTLESSAVIAITDNGTGFERVLLSSEATLQIHASAFLGAPIAAWGDTSNADAVAAVTAIRALWTKNTYFPLISAGYENWTAKQTPVGTVQAGREAFNGTGTDPQQGIPDSILWGGTDFTNGSELEFEPEDIVWIDLTSDGNTVLAMIVKGGKYYLGVWGNPSDAILAYAPPANTQNGSTFPGGRPFIHKVASSGISSQSALNTMIAQGQNDVGGVPVVSGTGLASSTGLYAGGLSGFSGKLLYVAGGYGRLAWIQSGANPADVSGTYWSIGGPGQARYEATAFGSFVTGALSSRTDHVQVETGEWHAIMRRQDGTVDVVAYNGSYTARIQPPTIVNEIGARDVWAGWNGISLAALKDGTLVVWGYASIHFKAMTDFQTKFPNWFIPEYDGGSVSYTARAARIGATRARLTRYLGLVSIDQAV